MNLDPQAAAVDRVLALVQSECVIETDPVDFVEHLLTGVTYRDLDSIADDIVCFVLRWDDLREHVKQRLEVQQAYADAQYRSPHTDRKLAAQNIVAAIRAIVCSRLSRGSGL